jgi:hypothetical protein
METMLTRRALLSQSTVLLLLVPVAGTLMACSSSGDSSASASSCDGSFETSTVTLAHTHTLCVPTTDLASAPSAGVTYTTSVSDGHDHTVMLTQAQLQSINGGQSVTVTTSSPNPHNFTIAKA